MNKKHILSTLLCVSLLVCSFPANAFATETLKVKPISFVSVMKSANKSHKSLNTKKDAFKDTEKYLKNSLTSANKVTDTEVQSILKNNPEKSVSSAQAKEDIDLYFRILESSYGAYYYFGADKFKKAKQEMLDWADSQTSEITPYMISEALTEKISFVRDTHFHAGPVWVDKTKERFHHYFYSTVRSYAKDSTGYYTYVKGSKQKWYVKSFTDSRVSLKKTLLSNGTIVYAPTLLCTEKTAKNSYVCLKAKDGRTKKLKVVFKESEPYLYNKGTDFKKVTNDGLAYISIGTFVSEKGIDFNAFQKSGTELRNAKLIIFDIRSNEGGESQYGRNWVGKFSGTYPNLNQIHATRGSKVGKILGDTSKAPLGKFQTIKPIGSFIPSDIPIIVLVDNLCGSAGESMLNYLKCLDNVVVIGSNSAGCQICGNSHNYRLPNSGMDFSFGRSINQVYNTNKVEYIGYAPDVWCNPVDVIDNVKSLLEKNSSQKDFSKFFDDITNIRY